MRIFKDDLSNIDRKIDHAAVLYYRRRPVPWPVPLWSREEGER